MLHFLLNILVIIYNYLHLIKVDLSIRNFFYIKINSIKASKQTKK